MKIEKAKVILTEIAEELGGKVREKYFGRGMGNTCCMGITCESVESCKKMAAKRGIRGASVDNMGLRRYIVYWRSLNTTNEPEPTRI